jgi:two-component system cell cycle sensor histidine kinase PleC
LTLPGSSLFALTPPSVSIDLTEQVQAQKIADTALQEAEMANQAKSQFLATMSHEFRTPLNAILGFSDILSHQYLGPIGVTKYSEYAEDIRLSGEHLLSLVNDLLDISTIEAGKRSLIKENLLTEEIVSECVKTVIDRAQKKGISLVTKLPEKLPPLYADKRATKQILLNLLSNAIKFTPEGGKITVSAKALKKNTKLTITDTGIGIPHDKLTNLTEPFTKVEKDFLTTDKGWGLGLAITQSLIDLHASYGVNGPGLPSSGHSE